MRILLTGGGTAGHINPAIAIANYIKEKESNCEFLFVGTEHGLETKLVPKAGYDIRYIEVLGLRRKLTLENFKVLVKYIKSMSDAKRILKEFKPDVVIGTGGYVCAPVVNMAVSLKIPTIIHEQNVFPGLAIKMLSQKVDITAISFEETRKMMKAKRMELTGNPLRPNLFDKYDTDALRREYGFDNKPIVLMFGGSLGSPKMNAMLVEMIEKNLIDKFNLIASTGEKHYEGIIKALSEKGIDANKQANVKIFPYIYNMAEIFYAADVVAGRAGAITVSEIMALGKAAVLIPSPYVAHNHQEYNARYLEDNGAAKMILEKDASGEKLAAALLEILKNDEALEKMKENSRKIGIADACEKMYGYIKGLM